MLHTNFQGHRPFGSEKIKFLRFLPYISMAAILVMWPGPFERTFFPHPVQAPYEIWLWLAKWFLSRRYLKSVDDGRRMDNGACLYYKLTYDPKGSGELKKQVGFGTLDFPKLGLALCWYYPSAVKDDSHVALWCWYDILHKIHACLMPLWHLTQNTHQFDILHKIHASLTSF